METILKDRSKVSPELTPCYNMSWLSIYDGLVFKGKRLVVPQGLRAEIKKDIRASHAGVDGCLRRARESVYWLGMNSELRHWISTCEPCRLIETSHGKEKREKIAVDLFTQNQLVYLVTVDYHSGYWELDRLHNTESGTVVRNLKPILQDMGVLVSLLVTMAPK